MNKWRIYKAVSVTIFIGLLTGCTSTNNDSSSQLNSTLSESSINDSSTTNSNEALLDNHVNDVATDANRQFIDLASGIATQYLHKSKESRWAPFVELFEKLPEESFEDYASRINSIDYDGWLENLSYPKLLSAEEEFYTLEYGKRATNADTANVEALQKHQNEVAIMRQIGSIHQNAIQSHLSNNNGKSDREIREDIVNLQYQIFMKSLSYQGAPFLEFIHRQNNETDYDYLIRLTTLSDTKYDLPRDQYNILQYKLINRNQIINQYEKWLIEEKGYTIRSDGKFIPSDASDNQLSTLNTTPEQLWNNYFSYISEYSDTLKGSIDTQTSYFNEQISTINNMQEEARKSMEESFTENQISEDGRIGVLPSILMTNLENTETTTFDPSSYDVWTVERQDKFKSFFQQWSHNIHQSFYSASTDNPMDYHGLSVPEDLFTHMTIHGSPQSVVYDGQIYQGSLASYHLVLDIKISYENDGPQLYLMTIKSDGNPVILYGQPEPTEGGTMIINFERTTEDSLQEGWKEIMTN